jgi:chromosome segregation ATPase
VKQSARNLRGQLTSAEARITELKSRQDQIRTRLAQIEVEYESNDTDLSALIRERKSLDEELNLSQGELDLLNRRKNILEAAIATQGRDAQRIELQGVVAQAETEITERMEQINRLSEQLKLELQQLHHITRNGCNAFVELQQLANDYNSLDSYNTDLLLGHKLTFQLPYVSRGAGRHRYVIVEKSYPFAAPPQPTEST